jgi:hypothetical protein
MNKEAVLKLLRAMLSEILMADGSVATEKFFSLRDVMPKFAKYE